MMDTIKTKGKSLSVKNRLLSFAVTLAGTFALACLPSGVNAQEADEDGYIPYVAAQNPAGWNIPYSFSQDITDPAYLIAVSMMKPTYKTPTPTNARAIVGLAQVRLDKDESPEIIAFPVEDEYETDGKLCNLNGLCPHYVIKVGKTKAELLGVLYGWKVNLGKRVLNGYYTLDVYALPVKNPEFYEEYAYNPVAHEYRPVNP